MNGFGLIDIQFEHDYIIFERYRMYPPGYGKEKTMKPLTLKHVSAISHSEQFIYPCLKQDMTPRHRKEIEDDLVRLAEVKRILLKALYEPGLPISIDIPLDSDEDGDTG